MSVAYLKSSRPRSNNKKQYTLTLERPKFFHLPPKKMALLCDANHMILIKSPLSFTKSIRKIMESHGVDFRFLRGRGAGIKCPFRYVRQF